MKRYFFPLLLIASSLPASAAETDAQAWAHSQSVDTVAGKLEQANTRKSAQTWGLTDEEWQRYQALMNGRRGVFSPYLDPITALGIEARTAEERRRFAELSVQQDFKRVEAELAFQREVDAAWKRLYPHILPIGAGMGSAPAQPRSHGRLALFVKADCPPCDKTLTKLLASQKPFDIYLVGSEGQDAKVREWASRRHIPAERVKTRAITLNHDAGRWLKLGKGQMPVVLEQGENGWLPVAF